MWFGPLQTGHSNEIVKAVKFITGGSELHSQYSVASRFISLGSERCQDTLSTKLGGAERVERYLLP